jgi:antitoxin component of RelBE/YafQ-DinJ toxin-antitoxin module
MNKTVLQVPVSKDLKEKAERAAHDQGVSSLQESIRIFLTKLATDKLEITIQEPIRLSETSEKRYLKQTLDFEKNKNSSSAKSVEELMHQLNENKTP